MFTILKNSLLHKVVSFLLFMLLLSIQATAQFEKFDITKDYVQITERNLLELEGKYSITPVKCTDGSANEIDIILEPEYHNLVQLISDSGEQIDFENIDRMELGAYDSNALTITFWRKDYLISSTVLEGFLTKDGFFQCNKRYTNSMGIPLLCGGKYRYESRIGLATDGRLQLQTSMKNQGTLLFFIKKKRKVDTIYSFAKIRKEVKA